MRQPLISCENAMGVASCKWVRPLFTMPSFSFSRRLNVSISASICGIKLSSIPKTAAMCIAVGNVSFELCDLFTSSFGCSSFSPAISFPRFAITSLAFMLDCVPLPVCHTTSGKCPFSFPAITSSHAALIASFFSAPSLPRLKFAIAAAFFKIPNACVISRGITSPPISKF